MSAMKKRYIGKIIWRCLAFVLCGIMYLYYPKAFDVLEGMNFFRTLSPLHALWALWVVDMLAQIIPMKSKISLGSLKLFKNRFKPNPKEVDRAELYAYMKAANKKAVLVFVLWCLLIGAIAAVYYTKLIGKKELFMLTALFYIFDLVCVLIWCPFRFLMGNRCCTTCRIFNWDHFMMFSPIIFLGGFYAISLVALSCVDFLVWELSVYLYPERFWEKTNVALRCSECTDKLCHKKCSKVCK